MAGEDSYVYHISNPPRGINAVAKYYTGHTLSNITELRRKNILTKYYNDTEKVKTELEKNPNPLNQSIIINNEAVKLEYQVIPQGAIMLKNKEVPELDPNINTATILGQKRIRGFNISALEVSDKKEVLEDQKIFIEQKHIIPELKVYIRQFFIYVSDITGVFFEFASVNVKLFYDKKNRKIKIVITDLAASLSNPYWKNLIK